MISCEEAAKICDKAQYNEATFFEKLKFWAHISMCKVCAQFTKENTKLTTLCRKANLKNLTEAEKEDMEQKLRNKF